jgi:hypothetical protein
VRRRYNLLFYGFFHEFTTPFADLQVKGEKERVEEKYHYCRLRSTLVVQELKVGKRIPAPALTYFCLVSVSWGPTWLPNVIKNKL